MSIFVRAFTAAEDVRPPHSQYPAGDVCSDNICAKCRTELEATLALFTGKETEA